MLNWNVRVSRTAQKAASKCPKDVQVYFENLLKDFEEEGPLPQNWQTGHLHGNRVGYLKARIKKYRVLYFSCSESKTVYVEDFGHRKDIYRRKT